MDPSGKDEPEKPAERDSRGATDTYWRVIPRKGDDGYLDIDFQVVDPLSPRSQRDLKSEVERALSVINSLYVAPKDSLKLNEAFNKLVALSRVGLVGQAACPEIAQDALRSLESDIVSREAGPVKNAYMRQLGIWALSLSAGALIVFFVTDNLPSFFPLQVTKYRFFFILWSGCMLGTWLSFASRQVVLGFYDLIALEEDRIEPPLRLIFSGLLTVVLGLIFTTGVGNVAIGRFSAEELIHSGSIAFLVGSFAGLSEKALPSAILSKATDILPIKRPAQPR